MEYAQQSTVQQIIDKLAKSGDIDAAEDWFVRMTDAEIEADVVSYSMILAACSCAGQHGHGCL